MRKSNFFVEESEFFKKKMVESLTETLKEVKSHRLTIDQAAEAIRSSAEQIALPEAFIQMMMDKLYQRETPYQSIIPSFKAELAQIADLIEQREKELWSIDQVVKITREITTLIKKRMRQYAIGHKDGRQLICEIDSYAQAALKELRLEEEPIYNNAPFSR